MENRISATLGRADSLILELNTGRLPVPIDRHKVADFVYTLHILEFLNEFFRPITELVSSS